MAIDSIKLKKMKSAGATSTQKRAEHDEVIERKGSQVSVYFDADDMEFLTRIKYSNSDVPRGKVLKYALSLLKKEYETNRLSSSELMGYNSDE